MKAGELARILAIFPEHADVSFKNQHWYKRLKLVITWDDAQATLMLEKVKENRNDILARQSKEPHAGSNQKFI